MSHVTASGIGVIIGAGIYVLIGPAAEEAGGLLWLSMVLSAVLCALTAFSYMELSSMFPKAGSENEFARQVFPDWISFTTGWAMAVALIVASAAVALGFARYLSEFVSMDERVGGIALLCFIFLISLTGMQHARWLVIALSSIQVGGLIFVITIGFHHIGDRDLLTGHGVNGVLGGAAVIFFAYIGFDEVITLAEETHNPRQTVPRALFLALLISTVLYVLVAVVAVSVLGADVLAVAKQPLTAVMRETIGGSSVHIMGGIALATTANTTLLASTAASRLIYSMADNGQLPGRWASIQKRRAPRAAMTLVILTSICLTLYGKLDVLASSSNALVYAMFIVVNLVVIILRFQQPDVDRPFHVWWSIGRLPVIPCLGILATIVMAFQLEVQPLVIGVGFLLLGVILHGVRFMYSSRHTAQ